MIGPNRLRSELAAAVEASDLVGVNLCLFHEGFGRCSLAAGFADIERSNAMTPEQQFPIFSITKTYTAVLALQLHERGRLSLRQTIDHWFPELPGADAITVEHLLSHTSGLPDYGEQDSYFEAVRERPADPWRWEQIVECALQGAAHFAPGEGWRYCNAGYWLVGEILLRVADVPLAELYERHIFSPLGLGRSFYPADMPAIASGWSRQLGAGDSLTDVAGVYHPGWAGAAGAIVATPGDVVDFYRALVQRDRVFLSASKQRMMTWRTVPGPHPGGVKPVYGLGIGREPDSPFGDLLGHGGWGPGFVSIARHFPDRGLTAVMLANSDECDPGSVFYSTIRRVLGMPPNGNERSEAADSE